jgi:hypothetical protein
MTRSISLAEIMDILKEGVGHIQKRRPTGIFLQPPVNVCDEITFEGSGEEHNLNTNTLPRSQLQSQAEVHRHHS